MKKVLFIDRDGTIILEPEDKQIDSLEKLEFYPKVISTLGKIASELDYELVMVSNQDGLGTLSFPEETFHPVQNKMLSILKSEGFEFSEIIIDRTL
ncbi:MAG: bifunctional histidinol-phosphatase/imidazoleglycerol-phosphate dehydratase, partial [Bacteroidota bacterium]